MFCYPRYRRDLKIQNLIWRILIYCNGEKEKSNRNRMHEKEIGFAKHKNACCHLLHITTFLESLLD